MKTLNDVEVGDLLILNRRMDRQVVKVERTTQTQIIISNGTKYKKSDGNFIGGNSFTYDYVSIPKDDEIEEIRKLNFVKKISEQSIRVLEKNNLTYEQAYKIKEILAL
jgi:hypothetical protein